MEDRYPLSFLRTVSGSASDPALTEAFKKRFEALSSTFQILDKAASFFYVFDFVQMRYLYVSESLKDIMGGYTAHDWMEKGPDWVLSLVYPEDVRRLKDLHKALRLLLLAADPRTQGLEIRMGVSPDEERWPGHLAYAARILH